MGRRQARVARAHHSRMLTGQMGGRPALSPLRHPRRSSRHHACESRRFPSQLSPKALHGTRGWFLQAYTFVAP